MSFTAKIKAYIRKHGMIAPGDRVGVAVSGGADSVALLRALLELRSELGCVLAVVHFNHKIRGAASDQDAAFVESLAREMGLEFLGGEGDAKKFAREHRVSLETAARKLRYGFFEKLASGAKAPNQDEVGTARLKPRPYERASAKDVGIYASTSTGGQSLDKIATAHTLDDQAETVLMKVLRGAGTKGLSGIWPMRQYPVPSTQYPEKREVGGGTQEKRTAEGGCATQNLDPSSPLAAASSARYDESQYSVRCVQYPMQNQNRTAEGGCATQLVRPMLGVLRKEVEAYLQSLGQGWREDASNRDVKHTRNKVRHELLPLLEREYNPNIYRQLADAAEVARAEEEYWNQYPVPSTQYSEKQNADPSTRNQRSLGMTCVRADGELERRTAEDGCATREMDLRGSETRHAASLRVDLLLKEPLALRRRIVRKTFERASGKSLDFEHTDALVRFLERRESSLLQLREHWFAVLDWPRRTVRFEERVPGIGRKKRTSKKQGTGGGG